MWHHIFWVGRHHVNVLLNAPHTRTHASAQRALLAGSWVSGKSRGTSKLAAAAASWRSPRPSSAMPFSFGVSGVVYSYRMPRSSHSSGNVFPAPPPPPRCPVVYSCTLDEGMGAMTAYISEKALQCSGGVGRLRGVVHPRVPRVVVLDDHDIQRVPLRYGRL